LKIICIKLNFINNVKLKLNQPNLLICHSSVLR